MSENWFDVDRKGLAAILERRGKSFAIFELVSNAWDATAEVGRERGVEITLKPIAGKPYCELVVEDWGEGFSDLDQSFTMFSRSSRAGDPLRRGRFNLGEKLVLACCLGASIISTGGGISFSEVGRIRLKTRREQGTKFTANIRMTRDEYTEACADIQRIIPPVRTVFNGVEIVRPKAVCSFECKLPTEYADAEGQLHKTTREATVVLYDGDGQGEVLELGIPVVFTENGYKANVLQKVPLSFERDNVTPGFLKALNAAILNNVSKNLTPEEASKPWVQESVGDSRATPEAVKTVIEKRFGERAVVATPGDPLANAAAEAAGYTVIPGGALSADAWSNVKKHEVLLPASRVFPSPKPEVVAAAVAAQAAASVGKCPLCGRSE